MDCVARVIQKNTSTCSHLTWCMAKPITDKVESGEEIMSSSKVGRAPFSSSSSSRALRDTCAEEEDFLQYLIILILINYFNFN